MNITKMPKFKMWLVMVAGFAALLFLGFYMLRANLRQTLFSGLHDTTHELKELLDNGTSPNGSLAQTFYGSIGEDLSKDLKEVLKNPSPERASFGLVVEETKSYTAGSAKIDGLVPTPPAEFLTQTKSKDSNQLVWHPAKGVWVAIDSATYHYGDITGYAITGRSANMYIYRLFIYIVASVLIWLATAVWLYRHLQKPTAAKK